MKSPQHRHHSAAVLLFVLAGCCVVGSASGKNLLSQLGNIMSDGKGDTPVIDYDAATGTVKNAVVTQDSSCDGQLASALVQANVLASTTQKELDEELAKHKAALETIVALQKDLAQTNSALVEKRDELSEVMRTITKSLQTEKNRSQEELEALKNQSQKELGALRDEKDTTIASLKEESTLALESITDSTNKEYQDLESEKDAIIASLNEESALALESVKDSTDKEYQDLKSEKDELISSLEAKLKMSSEELEATMREELAKAKHEKETQVAEITADRDTTVAELTQSMEKAAKDAAEVLQKTQDEAKTELATVEADGDMQLASLTQNMEEAAKEAAELLQMTKDESKAFLLNQVEAFKQQAEKAATEYKEQLLEKNKNIKNLQEFTEKMTEKKAAVERSQEEANVEISYWRHIHSQRSYCNMTHIATDMYDVSATAYKHSSDAAVVVCSESLRIASTHVSNGLEYSNRLISGQFDEHWPAIQPYYEEHVTGNYQIHLEPHLQKYIFPVLIQTSSWFHEIAVPLVSQVIKDGKTSYNARIAPVLQRNYEVAVRLYGNYCISSLQEFLKASQELDVLKDHPPPTFLLESWETSCDNPRDSMSALMQGTFVLFLVIFYRRFFGLAWSIIAFSVSLVIRLTPLRFVVPRRSITECIDSPSPPPPPSPSLSPPAMKEACTDSLKKVDEKENDDTNDAVAAELY